MVGAATIPGPWAFLILALAVMRICRYLGWDTFPPIARARDWATGAEWQTNGADSAEEPGYWTYRRPLLHELLSCAFCAGAWISLAFYAAWLVWPRGTLYVAVPFALSAAVGLIAKTWDG